MEDWKKAVDLNWHSVGRLSRVNWQKLAERFNGNKKTVVTIVYLEEEFIFSKGLIYARPSGIELWPEMMGIATTEGIIE